jgi:hypothetical protein
LGAILSLLAAIVFFWWFIQTAWLGSFPGRDLVYYSFWAYSQLAAAVVLLAFAVFAFVKVGRNNEPFS